jgi:hypothetical protein
VVNGSERHFYFAAQSAVTARAAPTKGFQTERLFFLAPIAKKNGPGIISAEAIPFPMPVKTALETPDWMGLGACLCDAPPSEHVQSLASMGF